MGKKTLDYVLDGMLERSAEANVVVVCAGEPADRNDAVVTRALAQTPVIPGDGNGNFVIANGDTSGRKVRTLQLADLNISTSGDADHIALCDATQLLNVTTCSLQTLTAGGTVTIPAFDQEVADPT